MPDLETRLPDLLRDLSSEMPVDPPSAPGVLRRARRRRLATATGALAMVTVLVVGSFATLRAVMPADRSTIGQTPPPTETGAVSDAPPLGLPAAVERTRDAIVTAVGRRDFGAMRDLLDPNTFSFDADDGSDPTPTWKRDPSVLDPIPDILALDPAAPKDIEGYGTFYVWPYLVDADFAHLTPDEIDDLHRLGFDDAAIERMRRHGGYDGPRVSIDGDGAWRSYSTGSGA